MKFTKTNKMATIYNGHTYIERRVYKDENGISHVRINGDWTSLIWCKEHYKRVDVWF